MGHSMSNQLKMNNKKTSLSQILFKLFLFHLLGEKKKRQFLYFVLSRVRDTGHQTFTET